MKGPATLPSPGQAVVAPPPRQAGRVVQARSRRSPGPDIYLHGHGRRHRCWAEWGADCRHAAAAHRGCEGEVAELCLLLVRQVRVDDRAEVGGGAATRPWGPCRWAGWQGRGKCTCPWSEPSIRVGSGPYLQFPTLLGRLLGYTCTHTPDIQVSCFHAWHHYPPASRTCTRHVRASGPRSRQAARRRSRIGCAHLNAVL